MTIRGIISEALRRHAALATLAVIAAAVVAAYYLGLHGPFVFDDFVNFVDNPAISIDKLNIASLVHAAQSGFSGPFKRPLAMVTFALNRYFAGDFVHTFPFKLTNLLIHLCNAVLVYWLTRLLLRKRPGDARALTDRQVMWISGLTAAAWALHPLQLTSVLYVVQRMNSLAALFVLAGLIVFVKGRLLEQAGQRGGIALMLAGIAGGSLLGIACKENAALLPLYALVIEFVFFRRDWNEPRRRIRLAATYGFLLIPAATASAIWLWMHWSGISGGYDLRDFTMPGRLLTEARVLWIYVRLLLAPDTNQLTLFHDDIPLSTGFLHPASTAFSVLALVIALSAALYSSRRYPLFSFSILWFLAGHCLESGFIGLEIAHEYRNYLPSFGPLLGAAYGLTVLGERLRHPAIMRAVSILWLVALAAVTHFVARTWASDAGLAQFMVEHHPASARSHGTLADIELFEQHRPMPALQNYRIAADLDPSETAYLIRMVYVITQTVATHRGTRNSATNMPVKPTELLYRRIQAGLQHQPVQARTTTALKDLADCIIKEPDRCAYLGNRVTQWYETAINNPRIAPAAREESLMQLVRLLLKQNKLEQAMGYAQQAREQYPAQPAFILMDANINLLAGRIAAARRILNEMRSSRLLLTRSDLAQADRLQSMISDTQSRIGHE